MSVRSSETKIINFADAREELFHGLPQLFSPDVRRQKIHPGVYCFDDADTFANSCWG